ncbi:hypothetical protein P9112_006000 [Eukaryota sp. TZLM1-RC]
MADSTEPLTVSQSFAADKQLSDLCADFFSVVFPVITTMLLVISFIHFIPLDSTKDLLAQLFITSSSPSGQAAGSLANAAILVLVIFLTTLFVLILNTRGCAVILKIWFIFSAFIIFFFLGSYILYSFVKAHHLFLDYISFVIIIVNISVLGITAIFFVKNPNNLITHASLIVLVTLAAHFMSNLPVWTLWMFVVLISLYDLYAVLHTSGPLRALTSPERCTSSAQNTTSSGENAVDFSVLVYSTESQELGLGDFLIYALLASLAFKSGFFVAILVISAIAMGLILTLGLLYLYERTLPALPISIGLGCLVFVLSRWCFSTALEARVFKTL